MWLPDVCGPQTSMWMEHRPALVRLLPQGGRRKRCSMRSEGTSRRTRLSVRRGWKSKNTLLQTVWEAWLWSSCQNLLFHSHVYISMHTYVYTSLCTHMYVCTLRQMIFLGREKRTKLPQVCYGRSYNWLNYRKVIVNNFLNIPALINSNPWAISIYFQFIACLVLTVWQAHSKNFMRFIQQSHLSPSSTFGSFHCTKGYTLVLTKGLPCGDWLNEQSNIISGMDCSCPLLTSLNRAMRQMPTDWPTQ